MVSNDSLGVIRTHHISLNIWLRNIIIHQGRKSILRIEISKNNPFRRRAAADEP